MIYFENVALSFLTIAFLLITYMLFYLKAVKDRRGKYRKWKNIADVLIRNAIFNEEPEVDSIVFEIDHRTKALFKNDKFRKILNREILLAKKNMSGSTGVLLQKLYLQLSLDGYALKSLSSKKWHIKAKAIQDLGIMGLNEYLSKVYRHTNNRNELVRMEAQIAVIKLTGFEGLRFLDVVSYQINNWQQIKLLNELSYFRQKKFNGIEKWLSSANESVVVFALKLVKNFHRLELYKELASCLVHASINVRNEAIKAIEKVNDESSAEMLLNRYHSEARQNQISIIKTVQQIGTEDNIPILISLLVNEDAEQVRNIVRCIANISQAGLLQLSLDPQAEIEPLNLIIKQIYGEVNT